MIRRVTNRLHHLDCTRFIDRRARRLLAVDPKNLKIEHVFVFPIVKKFAAGQKTSNVLFALTFASTQEKVARIALRLLRSNENFEVPVGVHLEIMTVEGRCINTCPRNQFSQGPRIPRISTGEFKNDVLRSPRTRHRRLTVPMSMV